MFLGLFGAGVLVSNSPGSFLDDGFTLRGDDLLGTSVQLRVLDEPVAVRESGPALLAAVRLLALAEKEKRNDFFY